ncbi:hypothetical protein SR1949_54170 [Sphaerospermopsis reniformis]|uniref:DUF4238 domain-containing protein n=1 Tax=Sphaerospermopsis reniformis TaxID=531300 RepID=A0A480AAU3_9CYAN|nr:hypothetical protein SR1949_54170 [Sphaerospermopsis reniformis]
MGNITINQHYVPQFLLRNFGWKAKKGIFRINIFDTKNCSIRPNQNISQVFSQNFFYDQDTSIEKFLNEIETPASTLVEQVINGNFKILENENNKSLIMAFISSFRHFYKCFFPTLSYLFKWANNEMISLNFYFYF